MAAISCTALEAAAPPISTTLFGFVPLPKLVITSLASASEQSIPSIHALAKFAGVKLLLVKPCIDPLALGKFGVLSPSKNGSNTKP